MKTLTVLAGAMVLAGCTAVPGQQASAPWVVGESRDQVVIQAAAHDAPEALALAGERCARHGQDARLAHSQQAEWDGRMRIYSYACEPA